MAVKKYQNVVIGAGPAGLSAGYELAKNGQQVLVIETEEAVGGLCRTMDFQGYKFDFGGHRFFTKNDEVQKLWQDLLGDDFLERDRLSRIYYRQKFFAYPIKLFDALSKLGPWESFLIGLSLIKTRIKKLFNKKPEITFEDWVVNRFGERLFKHFFKSYTEKLWGVSVKELGADWAAQRMKDLSLWQLLKTFVYKQEGQIKSLIEKFNYPKFGPGMFFERMAEEIKKNRGEILLNSKLIKIIHQQGKISSLITKNTLTGETTELVANNFISSMPLNEMLKILDPEPPAEIMFLVKKMRFRSFFDVCLIVNKKEIVPDNWIYIHEPEVRLMRLQNFKNWSPFMSPDSNKTPIGAEYTVWDTDELWSLPDNQVISLAKKELAQINLIAEDLSSDGIVIRNKYAYPVYHLDYKTDLEQIFAYLKKFINFQTIGRSGLYRYNNMDHSMLTGLYAARNILGAKLNILEINADEEYHEQKN
ncbi:MAG: NAD(P)/FAD-dependent oxidoreductase [Candidatus Buchananbacteria bacterium]